MTRVGFGKKVLMAAAIAALGATAMKAEASSVVFANFAQSDPSATPWTFTNAGAASSFTIPGGVLVNFNPTLVGLGQILSAGAAGPATATLSATVTGTATGGGGPGINIDQRLAGTLKFTNAALQNVLTVTFTGSISGKQGSSSSGENADTLVGDAITYSSDFQLGLFNTPLSFSISLIQTPGLTIGAGGYLSNFTASATGNFSADSSGAVPTPLPAAAWGGMSMLGALGGIGAVVRRRRR